MIKGENARRQRRVLGEEKVLDLEIGARRDRQPGRDRGREVASAAAGRASRATRGSRESRGPVQAGSRGGGRVFFSSYLHAGHHDWSAGGLGGDLPGLGWPGDDGLAGGHNHGVHVDCSLVSKVLAALKFVRRVRRLVRFFVIGCQKL